MLTFSGPWRPWMQMGISGVKTVDFSGSEGGVDASGLGAGIAAPIVGAMAKVTGMVKKEKPRQSRE